MNKENNINLIFSNMELEPKQNEIIIFPDKDNWNDFGHRIKCNFVINHASKENEIYRDTIFFGFQLKKNKEISNESNSYVILNFIS